MAVAGFDARMAAVAGAFDGGDPAEALRLARALKADLLAAAGEDGGVDPLQVGWARFYEVKSLHALEEWAAAHALLVSTEPVPFAVSTKNAAWMFSVGAECAERLGKVDEIGRFGERCWQARLEHGDERSAFDCVMTVCTLLARAGRPDLNRSWAERLLAIGEKHGAERAVLGGLDRLLDNWERSRDLAIEGTLRGRRARLVALTGGEFPDEARTVLARLDRLLPSEGQP